LIEYYGAESKGAWYNHKDIGKWQGKDGIKKLIEKDPKIASEISKILTSPAIVKIGVTKGSIKKESISQNGEDDD